MSNHPIPSPRCRPRSIAVAVAILLAPCLVAAESISLYTAWQKAAISEPAWRVAQADADVERREKDKALSGLLPSIGFSSTQTHNALKQPGGAGGTNNYESKSHVIQLRQPLFRMQNFSEYQRADARGSVAESRLSMEAQILAVKVAAAYFESLQTSDAYRYARFQEVSLGKQLDGATKSLRAGAATRVDVDEAKARLAIAVADRQGADNARALTLKKLSSLVGSTVTEVIPLDEERAKSLRLAPATLAEWQEIARQESPELSAAGKTVEEADWLVSTARSGHLPTLDLIASRSRSQSDTVSTINNLYDNRSIGVQLNVPIFSGGFTSADTAQAGAKRQRAIASRDNVERQLETRVLQEFNGVIQGEERLASLSVALDASSEALRSTRRGVQAGSRTSLDVLNAERQLYSSRLDKSKALYEWIMSRMRLKSIAGRLDEGELKEISGLLSLAATPGGDDSIIVRRSPDNVAVAIPVPAAPLDAPPAPAKSEQVDERKDRGEAEKAPVPSDKPGDGVVDSVVATTADDSVAAPSTPDPASVRPDGSAVPRDTKAPIIAASGSGRFVVALGAFGNPQNVSRLMANVEKAGIAVYSEPVGNGLVRVRAGPFASKKAARAVMDKLRGQGIAGVIDKR